MVRRSRLRKTVRPSAARRSDDLTACTKANSPTSRPAPAASAQSLPGRSASSTSATSTFTTRPPARQREMARGGVHGDAPVVDEAAVPLVPLHGGAPGQAGGVGRDAQGAGRPAVMTEPNEEDEPLSSPREEEALAGPGRTRPPMRRSGRRPNSRSCTTTTHPAGAAPARCEAIGTAKTSRAPAAPKTSSTRGPAGSTRAGRGGSTGGKGSPTSTTTRPSAVTTAIAESPVSVRTAAASSAALAAAAAPSTPPAAASRDGPGLGEDPGLARPLLEPRSERRLAVVGHRRETGLPSRPHGPLLPRQDERAERPHADHHDGRAEVEGQPPARAVTPRPGCGDGLAGLLHRLSACSWQGNECSSDAAQR